MCINKALPLRPPHIPLRKGFRLSVRRSEEGSSCFDLGSRPDTPELSPRRFLSAFLQPLLALCNVQALLAADTAGIRVSILRTASRRRERGLVVGSLIFVSCHIKSSPPGLTTSSRLFPALHVGLFLALSPFPLHKGWPACAASHFASSWREKEPLGQEKGSASWQAARSIVNTNHVCSIFTHLVPPRFCQVRLRHGSLSTPDWPRPGSRHKATRTHTTTVSLGASHCSSAHTREFQFTFPGLSPRKGGPTTSALPCFKTGHGGRDDGLGLSPSSRRLGQRASDCRTSRSRHRFPNMRQR
ncbi:hypothetical protein GQ53DRAFT_374892 [Thozetella sp. PMI_491]|nr:hypothetical protein GQ53DRAFT_374892 [Thozetella sp. PMI_491]